jgi:hypothetical protein
MRQRANIFSYIHYNLLLQEYRIDLEYEQLRGAGALNVVLGPRCTGFDMI